MGPDHLRGFYGLGPPPDDPAARALYNAGVAARWKPPVEPPKPPEVYHYQQPVKKSYTPTIQTEKNSDISNYSNVYEPPRSLGKRVADAFGWIILHLFAAGCLIALVLSALHVI